MKISVITASWNQGPFISRCIASVKEQAGEVEVEHIILDNCSTDGTAAILGDYRESPSGVDLKVFIEADKGQTAAINKGLSIATGGILCWLNTDEWYEPGALRTVVKFFAENPEIDVAFGDCDFVNSDGERVGRRRESFFSKFMLIFYGCFIPSCATFVRRKVVDAGILLDPEFRVIMDTDWYVRIADAGFQFGHLRQTLANFTWHQSNISKVYPERKRFERRLVADKFGGVTGPIWYRSLVYLVLERFWQSIRVYRRLLPRSPVT